MGYTRPEIRNLEFRDAAGAVIPFGERWADRDDGPPEDAYSREEHPERFAPLHTIAEALIAHLRDAYDVAVWEGTASFSELLNAPGIDESTRAVRITPRDPHCAPITLTFTDLPGVMLTSGYYSDTAFPSCGCSACDETWEEEGARLEDHVLAIVAGGFTERAWPSPWRELRAPDGSWAESGSVQEGTVPAERLATAEARLAELRRAHPAGNWQPWPVRVRP